MHSMAERAYRNLEPINLERHSDYLRKRLASIGALADGDTTHPRYPSMFDSPLSEGLTDVTSEMLSALIDLGYEPARVAALTVGPTVDDGFTARYSSFSDQTGLVLVSDSLITLCNAYCEYAGRAIGATTSGGLLRLLYSALRTRWTGALGENPRLLAGILRYHNVNRRVYGVAAILNFTPSADDHIGSALQDAVLEFGLRFIVGHEAAHHVLEHESPVVLLTPAESTSLTSDSEQRELDADTLALFAAAEAFARYEATHIGWLPERWRREAAEFHSLIGALITMLALQTSERALFVRPGRTHLPTTPRAMHLTNHILSLARQESLSRILGRRDPRLDLRFDKDRGNLSVYLRNLVIATEIASAFGEGIEEFDWNAIAASREIEKPLAGHLERVATLDRLMCSPDTILADEIGKQLDSEGTRLIMAGDTLNGLLAWGLQPDRVEAMNDSSQVLAFHTIVEYLQEIIPPETDSLRPCVAAATLVAQRLTEPSV